MSRGGVPDLSGIREEKERFRVFKGYEALRSCHVCPRNCGVNRLEGETGTCRTGLRARLGAANLHFGEEPCLTGSRGSGTVFFAYCNLACDFCQNFPISQYGYGREVDPAELGEIFLSLQRKGAHNINLVTPSHVVPQIIHGLVLARQEGLSIPVVYNSNGYDAPSMIELLDGLVDIYLPDMKYSEDRMALRFSKSPSYVETNRTAVRLMAKQVGPLSLGPDGLARRGLLVRHLLLPENVSGFADTARFIRESLGSGTAISLMAQYFPAHRAARGGPISRKILPEEYEAGLAILFSEGLLEGYVQDCGEDGPDPSGLTEQEIVCQKEKIFTTF
ncbi:MAG: radical SAM protein [Nitrospiraceae bacterium]|nr:radical SAM protein [Nitrospiraceae bacterium]